jgi:hypothetical protein
MHPFPVAPPPLGRKVPIPHTPKHKTLLVLGLAACLAARLGAAPVAGDLVTVVSSKVDSDYVRQKLPSGAFQTEYYAYANGGRWAGTVSDASIDTLPFIDVARTVAIPLESQNYLPTRDADKTRLLVVVYWGRTRTPEHANESVAVQNLQGATAALGAAKGLAKHQFYNNLALASASSGSAAVAPCMRYSADPDMDTTQADNTLSGALATAAAANRTRDEVNAKNASLLGYDSWWDATAGFEGTPLEHRRDDMVAELEHDRYFVILMAYDFQLMWKQKKHKLLWETRFSVQQRGIDFDRALPLMAKNASKYFGQDSHGLLHQEIPEGRVDVGLIQTLGTVAAK